MKHGSCCNDNGAIATRQYLENYITNYFQGSSKTKRYETENYILYN